MPRVPTPIPASLWLSIKSLFQGALTSILWRLFVLVVGVGLLVFLLAMSSSVFVVFTVTTILGLVFSDNLRMLALDIYYGRFIGISV